MKIYVVSLERAAERRERMKKRLAGRNAVFIDAVDAVRDKVLIDRIRDGHQGDAGYPINDAEIACFQSHLKALRRFVDDTADVSEASEASEVSGTSELSGTSGTPKALILEDDVMIHKNFDKKFAKLELPELNVVMLSYYLSGSEGVEAFNDQFNTIGPKIYGCYAYLILRDYAVELLEKYENKKYTEINEVDPRYTSEHITRFSGGVYLKDPLFIEESLDTHIQHQQSIQWHRDYFGRFGFHNYR